MSAFAEEMERLKVTEKVLVRDGKRLIRQDLKASQVAEPELLQEAASVEVSCLSCPSCPGSSDDLPACSHGISLGKDAAACDAEHICCSAGGRHMLYACLTDMDLSF